VNEAIIKSTILMGNLRSALDLRECNKEDAGACLAVWGDQEGLATT